MSQDQELMEQVKFGIEVEAFMNSRIGQYLVARAHREIDAAVVELKKANPRDAETIAEIQGRIYRAEKIDQWLAEAIQEGWNAEAQLRTQED